MLLVCGYVCVSICDAYNAVGPHGPFGMWDFQVENRPHRGRRAGTNSKRGRGGGEARELKKRGEVKKWDNNTRDLQCGDFIATTNMAFRLFIFILMLHYHDQPTCQKALGRFCGLLKREVLLYDRRKWAKCVILPLLTLGITVHRRGNGSPTTQAFYNKT